MLPAAAVGASARSVEFFPGGGPAASTWEHGANSVSAYSAHGRRSPHQKHPLGLARASSARCGPDAGSGLGFKTSGSTDHYGSGPHAGVPSGCHHSRCTVGPQNCDQVQLPTYTSDCLLFTNCGTVIKTYT